MGGTEIIRFIMARRYQIADYPVKNRPGQPTGVCSGLPQMDKWRYGNEKRSCNILLPADKRTMPNNIIEEEAKCKLQRILGRYFDQRRKFARTDFINRRIAF